MTIMVNGEVKRIGLALSGGGFRAAAFHVGVLRALQAHGLLKQIDILSCVSGGSIVGAYLALHWNDPDVIDKLDQYLATHSIAVGSVIAGLIDPFSTRLEKLAGTYDRDLYGGKTLSALQDGPRLYLNTTNLSTGNACYFVAGGGGKAEIVDHELGDANVAKFSIARAVAASSAFPPVFPPLRVDAHQFSKQRLDYITLTDGGVYDNLGINPMLRSDNQLDYVIVSDGGAPFAQNMSPTEDGVLVLRAALDIMMEQIRGLEFDRLVYRHAAKKGPKPLWFSIDSCEGEVVVGDAEFASAIGTNLKALSRIQREILSRHGAALLNARLTKYATELLA